MAKPSTRIQLICHQLSSMHLSELTLRGSKNKIIIANLLFIYWDFVTGTRLSPVVLSPSFWVRCYWVSPLVDTELRLREVAELFQEQVKPNKWKNWDANPDAWFQDWIHGATLSLESWVQVMENYPFSFRHSLFLGTNMGF